MKHLLLALGLALSSLPTSAAVLPANPATLASQLAKARGGDTIFLAPGSYGVLALADASFPAPVTITGKGAVLKGLSLQRVRGLKVTDLEFNPACGSGLHPLTVAGSKAMRFERLTIHGDVNCWSGLLVRDSEDVEVTGSEFFDLGVGLSWLNTSNFTAAENRFHDIASDGINGGCGANIRIARNRFTDFRPPAGAHPDAIQVWQTNCARISTDISIEDNIYVRGSGGVETVAQGVFVTSEGREPRMARVRITGNTMLGGMYNGITVVGVDDAEISGNTVAGFPDMDSWIRAEDSTQVQILVFPKGTAGVTQGSNTTVKAAKDRGASLLGAAAAKP